MIKRIEQWLARIFQTELAKATAEITALRAEVAAIKEHAENSAKNAETHVESVVDELFKDIKEHVETAVDSMKAHVEASAIDAQTQVQNSYDELKKHIYDEILKRYDTLVRDAAAAARVMDASKIAMAICDYCHLPKRRFSTSRIDGKIVCSDCIAKGQN